VEHLHLFAGGTYGANGLALAAAFSAAAIVMLGIAVAVRGRMSAPGMLFAAITLAIGGWLGSFAFMYASRNDAAALFWARAGNFAAALIAPAIFHFAAIYVGRERALRRVIAASWAICAILAGLSATATLLPAVHHFSWGYYPAPSLFLAPAVVIYLGVLLNSIRLIWSAYRESDGRGRERAQMLLIACGIGMFAFIDYLPSLGMAGSPIGHFFMIAFVIVAATSIWRFQVVDVTPEYAAESILDTMKSAVLVVDMAGHIRVANRAVGDLLGYDTESLPGTHVRLIIQRESNETTGQLLKSSGILEQTMVWRGANGVVVDVLVQSSFVRDNAGKPIAVVYVATDYTERKRAESALRASEHRYRVLFELNPLPMWIYDFKTLQFTAVNDAAVAHYGWSRREFLDMKITEIRPPEDVPALLSYMKTLGDKHGPRVFRHRDKSGRVFDVESSSFDFESAGRRTRLVIAQDVTERRRNEERYRTLIERNLAGVYRTSTDGSIIDCNDAFARMFGYETREEMLAQTAQSLYFEPADRDRLVEMIEEQKTLSNQELRMRRNDGAPIWVIENVTLMEDGVLEGTIIDITDRKTAQQQVEYQAYHDSLTGLPNRLLFRDRITMALAHAKRTKRGAAVVFLDIDQFKLVNDTLGHTIGDRLLQVIAARLVSCVRGEDTVARMGGDEFTILVAEVGDRRASSVVAQKVLESIRRPIVVDDHELFVTASVGVAVYPEDGDDAETLLKNADRAMYRAKDSGRNNYQYATPSALDGGEGRLALERSLRHALDRQEFVVHYQPIVEISSGRVVGAEALVRWKREDVLVQPDDFISIAEECNLVVPLGAWVLRTACTQMVEWHAAGHQALRIAVNLSARQLQQRELASTVERILAETGLPPSSLDLEITETAAMQNAELTLTVLQRLKDMGVRISIDDFGTGYSSLSYLKRFPIDTVKIDQNFVRDLVHNEGDAAIISAVISIARALQLDVVAEGVETAEQLAFLRNERCELVQGFLHSAPVSADEFGRMLVEGARRRAQGAETLRAGNHRA
jgi:diguanylate cyclase (GGDEF)-like protein/PAS domain S-box-containing protein